MKKSSHHKPEFGAGDVVMSSGALLVIVEYYPDGCMEDGEEYVGYVLTTLDNFHSHDVENGLPGCKSISHLDWDEEPQGLEEMDDVIFVMTDFVAYIHLPCELRLFGKLSQDLLERAEEKRFDYVFGPDPRITTEDWERRDCIQMDAMRAAEESQSVPSDSDGLS